MVKLAKEDVNTEMPCESDAEIHVLVLTTGVRWSALQKQVGLELEV